MNTESGRTKGKESPESFADELAEILELKLLGAETIDGVDWNDHASKVLSDYHEALTKVYLNQKPLWRELHENNAKLDASAGIHVMYAHTIEAISDQIKVEFGDSAVTSFLRVEAKKAFICE